MGETIITAKPVDSSKPTGPLKLTTGIIDEENYPNLRIALEAKQRAQVSALTFAGINGISGILAASLSISKSIELIENGGVDNFVTTIGFLALSLAQFYGATRFHSQSKLCGSQIDALAEFIPDSERLDKI